MKKKKILICLILIFSVSCVSGNKSDVSLPISMPDIGIPVEDNGDNIFIDAPAGWNSFAVKEPVLVSVINVSDKEILFGPDFGARLFVAQDSKWVEIKNKTDYSALGSIILEPNRDFDPRKAKALFLLPDLDGDRSNINLLIIVVGIIESGNNKQQIASSFFVRLHSK